MRNILRIFDAWHESFALISFCLSVALFIVLTGFLRTGHWLLVLALSIVICAGGLACFLGAALACTVAALGNFGANL